jgi:hypothetical protein
MQVVVEQMVQGLHHLTTVVLLFQKVEQVEAVLVEQQQAALVVVE